MSMVQLAYGDNSGGGNGSLFQTNPLQLAELALNISIGQVSQPELEQFVNPSAVQAEKGQPEGAQMQLDISGWTLFGTDYSQTVASRINSYWQQGQFTVDGEPMAPWPGYSQVAWGGNNTLTVRYLKGQIWILYIALAVALAYVALQIFNTLEKQYWGVSVNSTTTTTGGGWWSSLNVFEKGGIIALGGLILVGGLWFAAERSIAEAGASKSSIYIER